MRSDGSPRSTLCLGASDRSGRCPSRVWMISMPALRAAASSDCSGGTAALQQRHVVAERLAEAAGLQEVALHVDDDEGGVIELDHQRGGLGFDAFDAHDLQRIGTRPPCGSAKGQNVQDQGQARAGCRAAHENERTTGQRPATRPRIEMPTEAST